MELPKGMYSRRPDSRKCSRCQLELDVFFNHIKSHPCKGEWNKVAPLRILSFDIECAGRKGHFPEVRQATRPFSRGQKTLVLRAIAPTPAFCPHAASTLSFSVFALRVDVGMTAVWHQRSAFIPTAAARVPLLVVFKYGPFFICLLNIAACLYGMSSFHTIGRKGPGDPDCQRGEGARERPRSRQERFHARGLHPHRRRSRHNQRNRSRTAVRGKRYTWLRRVLKIIFYRPHTRCYIDQMQ